MARTHATKILGLLGSDATLTKRLPIEDFIVRMVVFEHSAALFRGNLKLVFRFYYSGLN